MQTNVLGDLAPQLAWLRNSGIQLASGPDAGGVRSWLDETPGAAPPKHGFIYSEITGYFMTLCRQLALAGDPEWIARGEHAAAWIVDRALHPSGAVLSRKYADLESGKADPYSFENGRIAFFDCAMVGFGLLQIHALTGAGKWLDAAVRIGGFLEREFGTALADGHSTFDLNTGARTPPADRWSAHFAPFELKGAMFLDALADTTGSSAPRAFANRILEQALAAQLASGRFPTNQSGSATHLHPHTYTIEGLIYLAARRDQPELARAAARGVDWSFQTCLDRPDQMQQWSEDGAATIEELRSDTLAQSLRAYALLKAMLPESRWGWEDHIPARYDQLATFALPSGGTSYGQDEYGAKSHHANAWCHMFAVEALLFRSLPTRRQVWSELILT